MILIDTNVVSEAMRQQPDQGVIAWLNAQSWDSLFLCTPVLAELHYGIERLARSRRKELLTNALDRIESELYQGRILTFDQSAAASYGRLAAERERQGRRMQQMDALIAAIALAHGATVATRDTPDFADLGIELINPFDLR
jgi:predicted nucleic acid-binding protein